MKKMSTCTRQDFLQEQHFLRARASICFFLYALNTKVCALVSHQPNESVVHNIFFGYLLCYCCLWWDGTTEVGPFETLHIILVVYLSSYHHYDDHAFI